MGDVSGTKKCRFCAEQIQADAIKCRFCGSMLDGSSVAVAGPPPPPIPPVPVRVAPRSRGLPAAAIVAIVVVAVLASVGAIIALRGDPAQGIADKPAAPPAIAPPAAEPDAAATLPAADISAAELDAAYRTNEVSADGQYKGKPLRVSGVVARISNTIASDPHLILESEYPLGGVTCSFRGGETGGLTALAPGHRVVLRGVGAGTFMNRPMLRRCVIESRRGPTCHVTNAEGVPGGVATGECKPKLSCQPPSFYYMGFCEGAADVVCCVAPPPEPPESSPAPRAR